MAKIKYGIFGPIAGKIGSLIGSSWMGIAYLKTKPKRTKSPKRSVAQVENNQKFAYVNEWLIPFHPYLTIGFSSLAIRKTAIGAALSAVYKTMFTGTMSKLEINYDKMQISSGSLKVLSNLTISFKEGNQVHLTWKNKPSYGSKYNDQIMLALYSEELEMTDGFTGDVSRAVEKHNFILQAEMVGKALHTYVAVVSYDRKKASETMYLGLLSTI